MFSFSMIALKRFSSSKDCTHSFNLIFKVHGKRQQGRGEKQLVQTCKFMKNRNMAFENDDLCRTKFKEKTVMQDLAVCNVLQCRTVIVYR